MVEKINVDATETREIDGIEPDLRAIGYHLQPETMRASVWDYADGESNNRHYQNEQEEFYHVLSGRFRMEADDETVDLAEGDTVVLAPDVERRLTALEEARVLVVGVPNVKDDGVVVE